MYDGVDAIEDFYTLAANLEEIMVYAEKNTSKRGNRNNEVLGEKLKMAGKNYINPKQCCPLL